MKLIEEQTPPRLPENRLGEVTLPGQTGGDLRGLGDEQTFFSTAIQAFDFARGGITAARVVLQITAPDRQFGEVR